VSGNPVRDAGLLLNVMSGQDKMDSTCLNEPVPDYTARLGEDLRGVRLGMPKEYFIGGTDPQVDKAVREAIVREGSFHLVKTQLRGRTWLRTTLINPLTAREDLTALMERLEALRP